jgi:hypothetical protein
MKEYDMRKRHWPQEIHSGLTLRNLKREADWKKQQKLNVI